MDSLELIDKREILSTKANNILAGAEKESRKLNVEEQSEFDALTKEIRTLEAEINKINTNQKRKMESKFSLLKTIKQVANGKSIDERATDVIEAGANEMRKAGLNYSGQIQIPTEYRATGDILATVATQGQENVPEDKLSILEPLYANLVLTQAGATVMSGLVGDISIPVYSGSTCGWAGEIDTAANGGGTFEEITLSPKRLTSYIDISKQFLNQDSNSAEEMLKRDIVKSISQKLEATILGDAAGSATQPAGIFNGVTAMGAALTYADVVDFEKTLELANVAGAKRFIVSPAAKAVLKTTTISGTKSDLRMLMEGAEVNGYSVLSTSNVVSKGLVFGDWEDYVIGQWGSIDLTVDPYTQAANGKIRLVINAYFDAKPRRANSFVKAILA